MQARLPCDVPPTRHPRAESIFGAALKAISFLRQAYGLFLRGKPPRGDRSYGQESEPLTPNRQAPAQDSQASDARPLGSPRAAFYWKLPH